MIQKNSLKYMLYLFISFYIFYTPEFFLAINIPIRSQYVVIIINGIIIIRYLVREILGKKLYLNWDKRLTFLYVGVLLSAIYFSIIALLNGQHTRIMQNTYVLFQLFPLIYIFSRLDVIGKTRIQKIQFFYNMTLIHGITVFIMFIIPNLKRIALTLYYLGREENIFISTMRIYGISGEYTFFTPIFHGIALGLAVYFILFENQKRFYLYIPFLFLSIALNGRTGLLIAIMLISIQFIFLIFLQCKNIFKLLLFVSVSLIFVVIMSRVLKEYSEPTYIWLTQSFKDVRIYLSGGEKQGTIDVLSDMVLWPKGSGFLFGEGFRLYGNRVGYPHSDIGFVNDMFMGGLIYCILLYGFILVYIVNYKKSNISIGRKGLLDIMFIMSLIIANYKGEALRGGPILIGVIILKYLIVQKEKVND